MHADPRRRHGSPSDNSGNTCNLNVLGKKVGHLCDSTGYQGCPTMLAIDGSRPNTVGQCNRRVCTRDDSSMMDSKTTQQNQSSCHRLGNTPSGTDSRIDGCHERVVDLDKRNQRNHVGTFWRFRESRILGYGKSFSTTLVIIVVVDTLFEYGLVECPRKTPVHGIGIATSDWLL